MSGVLRLKGQKEKVLVLLLTTSYHNYRYRYCILSSFLLALPRLDRRKRDTRQAKSHKSHLEWGAADY